MIKFKKLNFKDVKTSDFGKEVTIRVNAESIKHYARKIKLSKKIESLKLSSDDETAFNVAAGLMAICTDPATGEYSFHEDQLAEFVDGVSYELFSTLTMANKEVNPSFFAVSEEEVKTLSAKKKST